MTLPRKGLKTRPYSMDMNKDIVTLPKRGLKRRPYNIGMEKKGLKKYDYDMDMNKRDLKKLTKAQLIKLLLKQQAQRPRNSVNNMVNKHEDIIQPPEQFRDTYKPIPPPRTGKWESVKLKPVPRKSVKQMVKEYEDIINHQNNSEVHTSQSQNQRLTDHFKCKMHEDHQNQVENHHQSLKLKSI